MDKAQALLEKMGWKKGMGLGKNNDGIKQYIGVVKKNDTAGIGVDKFKWDDMWWDNIYKKASKNVSIGSEPVLEVVKEPESLKYGKFTKNVQSDSSSSEEEEIPDAELFAKCEGRMLRKYIPEGKLKRLSRQNNNFKTGNMDSDISATKPTPYNPNIQTFAKENGNTSNKRKKEDDSDSDDESELEVKKKKDSKDNGKSKKSNKKAKKEVDAKKNRKLKKTKKGKDTDSDSSSSESDNEPSGSSSEEDEEETKQSAISSASDSDKQSKKKKQQSKKSKSKQKKAATSSDESDSSSSSSEEESKKKKKKDKKKK